MLGLVKKNPNYYAKIKNQVLVVMDTTSPENAYYELEGAYIDLWNLIDGKNNKEMILERLSLQLELKPSDAKEFLDQAFLDLVENNIIHIS